MKKNWPLLVLLALGVALRLWQPAVRSLWGDEADSLFRIYSFSAHHFHYEPIGWLERLSLSLANPLKGHHLPAYYLLLSLWTGWFGVGEIALRSLSILLGILCIPMVYLLAREFYDERTARLCAFLAAVSSFAVLYSQEIRPYALMMLASTASAYFFWRLLTREQRLGACLGYCGASLVLVFSHLFGILALSAQSLYLVIAWLKERDNKRVIPLALEQATVYLLAAPVLLPIVASGAKVMAGIGEDFPFTKIPALLKVCLNFFAMGFGETLAPWHWLAVVPAGLVYLALFVLVLKKWQDKPSLCLLTLLFWPTIVGPLLVKLTLPKYLIVAFPFFLLLVGRGLSEIRSVPVRLALLTVIVLAQLVSLGNYFRVEEYHNANQMEPWRQVSGTLAARFRPNDVILVNSYDVSFRLMQYYLNIRTGGNYPVLLVKYPGSGKFVIEDDGNTPVYITSTELLGRNYVRIWLVNHLRDDRKTPAGAVDELKRALGRRYRLASQEKYLPYEKTLIAKLPFFKPKPGESRIIVELYDKIGPGTR
jgi:uncharacterized membrane protein